MKVQLSYGAFTQTMSIYIDDQPLSHVSRLTKYQSQPFETWCEEITPHRPNTIFHQRLLPNTTSIYCGYVHFIPFLKLNSMCPSCWMITLSTSATNDPGSKPAHSFILSISFLRRRRWGLPAFQSDSGYPVLLSAAPAAVRVRFHEAWRPVYGSGIGVRRVVPVYDTDAAAVSLHRIDGCGAAERINIPKNSATADAELRHKIGDRFLPLV